MSLPAEIWSQVFDLATDEDILFRPGIPTSLAESAWHHEIWKSNLTGHEPGYEWRLRSPEMAMDMLQKGSYNTKMSIISTCRQWRQIGFESLFRCLYFNDPSQVVALCSMLESTSSLATTASSSYGWWTRRIHIVHHPFIWPPPTDTQLIERFQESLVTIIRRCPNVELFFLERSLGPSIGPVMDALTRYASRHLHTISLSIPGQSVSKFIWTLSVLPRIISAHVAIETDVGEIVRLGSAADLELRLPYLQQISLRGYVDTLLEQLVGWDLPSLRSFSVDNVVTSNDVPDVVEFLKHHGTNLFLLDLNLKNFVEVPLVLDLCPVLQTFAFNADWQNAPSRTEIFDRPHQHIITIGLHGLRYAFGVGNLYMYATAKNSFEVKYATRSNELNMDLLTKSNFPKLQRVRVLDRSVLEDLNSSNGPSIENNGYDRWSTWWWRFSNAGIRLEDCTGQPLGTLPGNSFEGGEDDGDESGEEESEDEHTGSSGSASDDDDSDGGGNREDEENDERKPAPAPVGDRGSWRVGNVLQIPEVLTQLIEEVKIMNETRDEALIASIIIPRPPSPPSD